MVRKGHSRSKICRIVEIRLLIHDSKDYFVELYLNALVRTRMTMNKKVLERVEFPSCSELPIGQSRFYFWHELNIQKSR